jgi:asparagine synthase (glutamine-hydrolysing)
MCFAYFYTQNYFCMCGILGFAGDWPHEDLQIRLSMDYIAHRGPDARGVFQEDEISLAHLRLSIIDLSDLANQPMKSHNGRYVMVYNGEIYNFMEIKKDILKKNPEFVTRSYSDTEIIIEAFSIWGIDFVQRLNGMFAIAIWDRWDKKLFIFRDRLGIKPIYYYYDNRVFAFASELKALTGTKLLQERLTIDPLSINQFLHLGYIPAPGSIYKQIRKMPAGHRAVVSGGQLTIESWWNPVVKILPAASAKSTPELLEELRELVYSSVKYRLIADVPFGTFLSGGVDSSLVTGVAAHVSSTPINTFNIGFWDKDHDESVYAGKIAQHLGTRHYNLMVTEKDALEWIPRITGIYDEPYADSSAIPTLLVSHMARQHVTMTLSGDGGDELFMGYGAYRWAERLSNPLVKLAGFAAKPFIENGPLRYRRTAAMFDNIPQHHLKSHIFSQEQYLFTRREIKRLMNPEFFREFSLDESFDLSRELKPSEQQALFDIRYYLPDDLLVKVDRASMHFALETRVPLLDYRIVEWALNLPLKYKMQQGQTKWMLRQLLYQLVPAELIERPKKGFSIPLRKWLQNELKDLAMDYLNENALRKTGLLDVKEANRLISSFYRDKQHYQYNKVWLMLILQKWMSENSKTTAW